MYVRWLYGSLYVCAARCVYAYDGRTAVCMCVLLGVSVRTMTVRQYVRVCCILALSSCSCVCGACAPHTPYYTMSFLVTLPPDSCALNFIHASLDYSLFWRISNWLKILTLCIHPSPCKQRGSLCISSLYKKCVWCGYRKTVCLLLDLTVLSIDILVSSNAP